MGISIQYAVYYATESANQLYQRYDTKEEAEAAVRWLKKNDNNAWYTVERDLCR